MKSRLLSRSSFIFLLVFIYSQLSLAAVITRGPYLQMANDEAITIRWRTNDSTDSVVRYGFSPSALNQTEIVSGNRTEHTVRLTGLSPLTQYYYSVGSSSEVVAGGDNSYRFTTSPVPGNSTPTRVWIIGDSGTANSNAAAVYHAYLNYRGADSTDLWLMLGDNAYNDGTDSEYQRAVFNMYPELLRRTPLWSTLGNHDGRAADSASESGPYYDIFNFPRNGESGGVASGTEAYYSFDYGDIHFITLDSYESDRSVNGAMLTWLENDLAATNQQWIIAFWHHPPYTKGSHNSDSESALIQMRQNALPILESYGVDLVFSGHSHSYERSYLIDGHYGSSGSFSVNEHVVDGGNGRESSDGAYQKADQAVNAGTVYTVAGASGKISGGSLNHPAMLASLNELGSVVLDINGNRLDAYHLRSDGSVTDSYTVMKGPDITAPTLQSAIANTTSEVTVEFSEALDANSAQNSANYRIDNGIDILSASISGRRVTLTTSILSEGITYSLVVNNIQDQAGNVISANSSTTFEYQNIQTVSFQDSASYNGTQDTYIASGAANNNYGSSSAILADGSDGSNGELASLLKWDLATIPVGARITAAQIELNVFNPSGGSYNLYTLDTSWSEGSATWNTIDPYTNRGVQIASVAPSSSAAYRINLNAAGIAAIQNWVDGFANNGVVIMTGGTSDGIDMRSSEYSAASLRPRLIVTYAGASTGENNPPVAGFNFSANQLSVDFTDTSSDSDGSISAWSWGFGDGSVSSEQNPSYTYNADGTYQVGLTVTDSEGATDSISQAITVESGVVNTPPSADFVSVVSELAVEFSDASSDSEGSIVTWLWNFGDGNTSSLQNPNHVYAVDGIYSVTLTVTDSDGATDSISRAVTVTASSAEVTIELRNGLNGYNGMIDTYVAEGRGTSNYGSASAILADGDDGNRDELISLLKWDVSAIPSDATVTNVTITLQVFNRSSRVYHLWALERAWSENNATWNNVQPESNRGDRIASFTPSSTGSYDITLNSAGIALVQRWINGSANNGMTIESGGTRNGIDMRSSEYSTQSQRPSITITYQ